MYFAIDLIPERFTNEVSSTRRIMKLLALLLIIPAITLAQLDITATINGVFDALDYNLDGLLYRPEIDQFFRTYDANHDGRITEAEYRKAVDENFAHDQDLNSLYHNLFGVLDTDKDNAIEHSDLDVVFNRADGNKNGVVTRAEFQRSVDFSTSTVLLWNWSSAKLDARLQRQQSEDTLCFGSHISPGVLVTIYIYIYIVK
ncbi:hypothetical protein Btru_022019 [Bulinus truncatus]|nr:hypothetical protein Btru_022019 [Bulinus truncatus]